MADQKAKGIDIAFRSNYDYVFCPILKEETKIALLSEDPRAKSIVRKIWDLHGEEMDATLAARKQLANIRKLTMSLRQVEESRVF